MNEHISQLILAFDYALVSHQRESESDSSVFDALGALAYFSGTILSQAPDEATRIAAHEYFIQMLTDGLRQDEVTKH